MERGERIEAVLKFWFGDPAQGPVDLDERNRFWFDGGPHVDDAIRRRFDGTPAVGERVEVTVDGLRGDAPEAQVVRVEDAPAPEPFTRVWVKPASPRSAGASAGASAVLLAQGDRMTGRVQAADGSLVELWLDSDFKRATYGLLSDWKQTPRGALALIILWDQMSRNMFRGTPRAFSQDGLALELAQSLIATGADLQLSPVERNFAYLPLEHAEDLDIQKRSVAQFKKLLADSPPAHRALFEEFLDYAERHFRIIERFGRYPHRNEALGRRSTEAELWFLKTPNSSF